MTRDSNPEPAATDPYTPEPAARTGAEVDEFRRTVLNKLIYAIGKDLRAAKDHDWFMATALAVRDRIVDRWMDSTRSTYRDGRKRVYYLSLEFLIGRLLFDSLHNLGLTEVVREALAELGVDLDRLRKIEPDAALGNGGLGRLAACYLESMASLSIAAHGYGIRYDHGIFRQALRDGWQEELPEDWLSTGDPWEFARPEVAYNIGFGGTVDAIESAGGMPRYVWHPAESVTAVAYDTPITGWRGRHINTLRLWSARAAHPISLDEFNRGNHVGALADRVRLESISRVLYPSDATSAGQELRLQQEFFFASASLQDLIRRHQAQYGELSSLPDHATVQLNDTHPSIAIAEMMRLLVDNYGMPWTQAWQVATATFNYTNHTLLPEALESWPVPLMERLLPRHIQIIFLINTLHLDAARAAGADDGLLSTLSLVDESNRARMGHLAFVGSHRINGVSALHTELMRSTVFHHLNTLYPNRIVNETNGITFRRWLHEANPGLTRLIVQAVGARVLDDERQLESLVPLASDAGFQESFSAIRRANKITLARVAAEATGVSLDPNALFDAQVKRIHEYKRQLLNVFGTIALYNAIRAEPNREWVPRVKIFAGKAAASYHMAKLIIKLINDIAATINNDPAVRGLLKVVFLPNYNVSLAECIMPGSDLSEQISTAGMEASGTGNMKFALNGALTIGTLDGANIEITDRVGRENIFIFGLTAGEVEARRQGGIDATATIAASPALAQVLDAVGSGVFSPDDRQRYAGLVDTIRHHDHFMVAADFEAYSHTQDQIALAWQNPALWWQKAILNTARVGWFSADRAIRGYARDIWDIDAASF